MTTAPDIVILRGLPLCHRGRAAGWLWAAFGDRIAPGLTARAGRAMVRRGLRRERVLAAATSEGALLGLVALRGPSGGLIEPSAWAAPRLAGPLTRLMARVRAGLRSGRAATTADLVLDALVVGPGDRRQGVARALIRAAAAETALRGHPALRAEVAPGNAPALALYRALGFAEDAGRAGRVRLFRLPVTGSSARHQGR